MKNLLIILTFLLTMPVSFADQNLFNMGIVKNDTRNIKSLLNSQVRYANKTNFNKFISTYDENYINSDGFNLETYSSLVKDIWSSYDKIEYGIKIKSVAVENNTANVEVTESSKAKLQLNEKIEGTLESESNSVYNLKKINGKWKVISDKILDETTSMLYGDAKKLNITLTAPKSINAGEEYTATLEFIPPENVIAIASIASDKVEYPQKNAKEVYRKFPEDNVLERIFRANSDSVNEYVVASIALTKADIDELNVKLSLTGFGYKIIRVNVIPKQNSEECNEENK